MWPLNRTPSFHIHPVALRLPEQAPPSPGQNTGHDSLYDQASRCFDNITAFLGDKKHALRADAGMEHLSSLLRLMASDPQTAQHQEVLRGITAPLLMTDNLLQYIEKNCPAKKEPAVQVIITHMNDIHASLPGAREDLRKINSALVALAGGIHDAARTARDNIIKSLVSEHAVRYLRDNPDPDNEVHYGVLFQSKLPPAYQPSDYTEGDIVKDPFAVTLQTRKTDDVISGLSDAIKNRAGIEGVIRCMADEKWQRISDALHGYNSGPSGV